MKLADGTPIFIRPIHPGDAPRLQALFDRLSPESVYFRFLIPMKRLSVAQAEFLTTVDYRARMALVASRQRDGAEEIIAVARYGALGAGEPGRAEFAIAVEDAYQGQGLGTLLMQQLAAYAREQGFHTLVGTVAAGNARMLRFVRRLGLACRIGTPSRGEVEVVLSSLTPDPSP